MGRIERFEDLIAWQRAQELTRAIYDATRQGAFAKISKALTPTLRNSLLPSVKD